MVRMRQRSVVQVDLGRPCVPGPEAMDVRAAALLPGERRAENRASCALGALAASLDDRRGCRAATRLRNHAADDPVARDLRPPIHTYLSSIGVWALYAHLEFGDAAAA